MIPGPDLIYACPQCKGYISTWSILSGNTHNAILYSDLKEILPMLPTRSRHGKCSCCQHPFWTDQLKFIGEYDSHNSFDDDDWPLPFDDDEPEEEKQVEQKQQET